MTVRKHKHTDSSDFTGELYEEIKQMAIEGLKDEVTEEDKRLLFDCDVDLFNEWVEKKSVEITEKALRIEIEISI